MTAAMLPLCLMSDKALKLQELGFVKLKSLFLMKYDQSSYCMDRTSSTIVMLLGFDLYLWRVSNMQVSHNLAPAAAII